MARGEITGKKPTATSNRAAPGHNRGPPLEDVPKYKRRPVSADANSLEMSIREFGGLHGIPKDKSYKRKREGGEPPTRKVGARRLITHEAAAAGRAEREAAEKKPPEKEAAAKKPATAA